MSDFKEDIRIDEFALDKEWIKQPRLFAGYAEQLAEADRDYAKVKEKVELVRAQLIREITSNPGDYGLEKATVVLVEATVLEDGKYRAVQGELVSAKYDKDMIQNAVRAMDMKKSALENLVRLHGQNYFSTPCSSGEHNEKIQEIKEDSAKEIIKERKRSRRRGE